MSLEELSKLPRQRGIKVHFWQNHLRRVYADSQQGRPDLKFGVLERRGLKKSGKSLNYFNGVKVWEHDDSSSDAHRGHHGRHDPKEIAEGQRVQDRALFRHVPTGRDRLHLMGKLGVSESNFSSGF